jgi:hypothetical protein
MVSTPAQLARYARYRKKNRAEINRKRRERYAKNPQKDIAYTKLWRQRPENKCRLDAYQQKRKANPEYIKKHREEARRYAAQNREKNAERARQWRINNPDRFKERNNEGLKRRMEDPAYREAVRLRQKKYNLSVKLAVFQHYGGACACCSESSIEFLCIDHINGNGNKHRRQIGSDGGSSFYLWLKRNGFPEGFQVLCHNCNMAKSCYGACPHRKEKV